jgi:hypothetical protein
VKLFVERPATRFGLHALAQGIAGSKKNVCFDRKADIGCNGKGVAMGPQADIALLPKAAAKVRGTAPGARDVTQAFTQSALKAELATFRPALLLLASRDA